MASNPLSIPDLSVPKMPAKPALDGRAPNTLQRSLLKSQLGMIPGQYAPQMQNARNQAQAGLAGYGNYKFGVDNPTTKVDESLVLEADPKRTGQLQQDAIDGATAQANAQGILSSSFAKQNVASAVSRLDEEARGKAMQYAADIERIAGSQHKAQTDITNELARLYGEDARWLAENPTPPPRQPVRVWKGKAAPNMETLRARHPGWNLKSTKLPDGSWEVKG